MGNNSVIVLCSGGLDSSCLSAYLKLTMDKTIYPIFIDRQQRAKEGEYNSLYEVCKFLGIEENIHTAYYDLALKDSSIIEKMPEEIISGYISHPERNLAFVILAYGVAANLIITEINIACNKDDDLPDTNKEFFDKANETLNILEYKAELALPFSDWSKAEIISWAANEESLGLDFLKLTRSCWQKHERHCGSCIACELRKMAFKDAGIDDPTDYIYG